LFGRREAATQYLGDATGDLWRCCDDADLSMVWGGQGFMIHGVPPAGVLRAHKQSPEFWGPHATTPPRTPLPARRSLLEAYAHACRRGFLDPGPRAAASRWRTAVTRAEAACGDGGAPL